MWRRGLLHSLTLAEHRCQNLLAANLLPDLAVFWRTCATEEAQFVKTTNPEI